MIIKFKNDYLERLYMDDAIKGKPRYSYEVIDKFRKKVNILKNIDNSKELKNFRSLNFEALLGKKKGLFSVRVNKQYRLIFELMDDIMKLEEIVLIEELSKHYE